MHRPHTPASGSEAVVCRILISACVAIIVVSVGGWLMAGQEAPLLEVLLPLIAILGATARLRGWAPTPKGGAGGGGP
jgi:hypothetical protein